MTTHRHVGFEATPAEQTAAGGGQPPGAAGQARPQFRWDSDAARFGTTSMGYAREVAELFLGRNARASLDQVTFGLFHWSPKKVHYVSHMLWPVMMYAGTWQGMALCSI